MLEKGNTELGIPQITYKKVGRKTKKDDATVNKLYSAFAIGASVEDACAYARISKQTFYDWCKNDQQFSDDMNDIRNNPILKAYDTMYKNLDDPKYALEVLKRRRRKDWAERIEQTGA